MIEKSTIFFMRFISTFFAMILLVKTSIAQVSVASLPYNYSQDFNAYIGSAATLPTGWSVTTSGNATSPAYKGTTNVGVSGNGSGGLYAFGTASAYSFGINIKKNGGNNVDGAVLNLSFTNNTGTTIDTLILSWDYGQFGAANVNRASWNLTGTGSLAANATLNSKDYTSPGSGATSTSSVALFTLTGLNIANGAAFGFQFEATGASNDHDNIFIDNFTLTANTLSCVNTLFYADADGDGYGNKNVTALACSAPTGYVADSTDCNDANGSYHVVSTYYIDVDGDGFGSGAGVSYCVPPSNYVANNTDCNPADPSRWQTGSFWIDADGDNRSPSATISSVCYGASTPTGYSVLNLGFDCNDNNFNLYDSLTVFIDVDNDNYKRKDTLLCRGAAPLPSFYKPFGTELGLDCNDNSNTVLGPDTLAYTDADSDGFGTGALTLFCRNLALGNYSGVSGDCNDNNAAVGLPNRKVFADVDGDTKGDRLNFLVICPAPAAIPGGYVLDSTDCNDGDNTRWILDSIFVDFDGDSFTVGKDLVCHGTAPEPGYSYVSKGTDCDDADPTLYRNPLVYIDLDGDGLHGSTSDTICFGATISAPFSLTSNGPDCDDADANASVLRPLFRDYDGDGYHGRIDSVCYGLTFPLYYTDSTLGLDCRDSSALEFPGQTWYFDNDGDGFGNPSISQVSCTQPAGYGAGGTGDCNDNNINVWRSGIFYEDIDGDGIYKRIVNICYGAAPPFGYVDTTLFTLVGIDCDDNTYYDAFLAPEAGLPIYTMYADNDGDSYGAGAAILFCTVPASGYSFVDGDCNDNNPAIDNTTFPFYKDEDGDGFGNVDSLVFACSAPTGYVADDTDCDDTDSTQFPGQVWYDDGDGDGFGWSGSINVSCSPSFPWTSLDSTDCNRFDGTRWRSGEFFIDLDGDLYDNGVALLCYGSGIPAGYADSTWGADCNDGNEFAWRLDSFYVDQDVDSYSPGKAEVCYGAAIPFGFDTVTLGFDCDDNDTLVNVPTLVYYVDADGDTYGAGASSLYCSDPGVGYSLDGTDCDDTVDSVWTGAVLYTDVDADGYWGDTATFCYGNTLPAGYLATTLGADCDDTDSTLYTSRNVFVDVDLDGYNNGQTTVCYGLTLPVGVDTVSLGTDCDDNDPNKWRVANAFVDTDNDGYTAGQQNLCYGATLPAGYKLTSLGADCNDNNAAINPAAAEISNNGVDENCDGLDWGVGIEDVDAAVASVYPNPGDNIAVVQLSGNWTDVIEVAIRDMEGRTVSVQTLNVEDTKATINTQNLASGIYVISITDSRNTASVRWTKN